MDERALLALASRQGGVISREQALELGMTKHTIRYRVSTGRWTLAAKGIYRALPAMSELDVLRSASMALPDPVVSHGSAGRLHQLVGVPSSLPTLTVRSRTTHHFDGARIRRSNAGVPDEHRSRLDGLVVTSVARTVVDLAVHMADEPWDRLAQEAVVARRCSLRSIEQVAETVCGRGRPGSARVHRFLQDQRAPLSALERRAAELLGPLRPETQYRIPWSTSRRFDFAFADARVAVELDSFRWHATSERMTADRRRDREAARHGWVVVRVTWDDLDRRPGEVLRTIVDLVGERSAGARRD